MVKSAIERVQQGKEESEVQRQGKPGQAAILNRVVRKSLTVEKHRLERGERMSLAGTCGKSNPGRNSQCKGPEIEAARFFFFFLIFFSAVPSGLRDHSSLTRN